MKDYVFLILVILGLLVEAKASSKCGCTQEYNRESSNENIPGDVRGYCNRWSGHDKPWCFLAGERKAASCPGATITGADDKYYYWTDDSSVCKDSLRLWGSGYTKVAAGKSCNDAYTGKFNIDTVGECAKTCSGSSTAFIFGATEKGFCYCITGASSKGECTDPYDNSRLDTYRYNGVWNNGFAKIADGWSCKDSSFAYYDLTLEKCAKACFVKHYNYGSSTVFVYGKTNEQCYCIYGASSKGVCSKPYEHSSYDTYRYDGVWESGFSKVASKTSCYDTYKRQSDMNTVGECASSCSDSTNFYTLFVYGTSDKRCYCVNGAASNGECSSPYTNEKLDTYRYNSMDTARMLGASFKKLDQGLEDKPSLATEWGHTQKGCRKDSKCNVMFTQNNYATEMEQVALGYSAAQDIATGVSEIVKKGKFKDIAKALGKLAPFLGAYGAVVNIVGLFGESGEVQRLNKVMKMLNDGFDRIEYRFDKIEESLSNVENTVLKAHFWTRRQDDLNILHDAQTRVHRYFSTTDPDVREERREDLDEQLRQDLLDSLNRIKGVFDGAFGHGTLCDQATKFSKVDRDTVIGVNTDLYNRMIKGAMNYMLIVKTLKKKSAEQDEKDLTKMLKDTLDTIQACDAKIKSSGWLKQWRSDLDSVIGDIAAGKEKQLADNINNKLTAKYPWRDWLVVVYTDVKGPEEHYRGYCWVDSGYTVNKIHWKDRYNILVSSISHETASRKYTGVKTGYKSGVYWARDLYDKFPSSVKTACTYPLKGVVTHKATLEIRAPENRKGYWKKVYGHDGHYYWNVFVLG